MDSQATNMDSQDTNNNEHIPDTTMAPRPDFFLEDVEVIELLFVLFLAAAYYSTLILPVFEAISPDNPGLGPPSWGFFRPSTDQKVVAMGMCIGKWLHSRERFTPSQRRTFLIGALLALLLPCLAMNLLPADIGILWILQIITWTAWYHYQIGLPQRLSEIVVVVMLAYTLLVGISYSTILLVAQATSHGDVEPFAIITNCPNWAVWSIVSFIGFWIQWYTRTPVRLLFEMLAATWTSYMVTALVACSITELADTIGIFKPEFVEAMKFRELFWAWLVWILVMQIWQYKRFVPIFAARFEN
jgi:hypothetical protein